jgi:hypothetical protein
VTTLEVSELGFEGPANEMVGNEMAANEMAMERRAALPEILAFRIARLQALGLREKKAIDPAESVVIDARDRFGRR